ncbi:uncharacterized protein [Drosophila takahashii]|uniref:uncharacterized protein n=1 Tax=Drosophila takahashii TaxID=29030 RepID=UPI0038991BD0
MSEDELSFDDLEDEDDQKIIALLEQLDLQEALEYLRDEDDQKIIALLEQLDLQEALEYLRAAKVKYESLRYITSEEIMEAIPPLGLRIMFREKLFSWRSEKFGGQKTMPFQLFLVEVF